MFIVSTHAILLLTKLGSAVVFNLIHVVLNGGNITEEY